METQAFKTRFATLWRLWRRGNVITHSCRVALKSIAAVVVKDVVLTHISFVMYRVAAADSKHTDLQFLRFNTDLNVKSDKFFGPTPSTSLTMQTKENMHRIDRFADKLIADMKDDLDDLVKLMLYAKPGYTRDNLKLK